MGNQDRTGDKIQSHILAQRQRDRSYYQQKREEMTGEEIVRRRERQRESSRIRIENKSQEEKEARLEKRRVSQRLRRQQANQVRRNTESTSKDMQQIKNIARKNQSKSNHIRDRQETLWRQWSNYNPGESSHSVYTSVYEHCEPSHSVYEHGESSGTVNEQQSNCPENGQQTFGVNSNRNYDDAYELDLEFELESFDQDHRQPNVCQNEVPLYDINDSYRPRLIYRRSVYGCARNFHEYEGVQRLHLPEPSLCSYCHALLFHHETSSMCCNNGVISLEPIRAPDEIVQLFSDQTALGREFRQNIRSYNHVFSFTSMGVQIDENLASRTPGLYTFRAQGAIYHRIGNLLPNENERPRYLQLYIYDTDHETQNRLQENSGLRSELLDKIKHILDTHNPFVHTFRHMAAREDINECFLQIKEQSSSRRQYDLPIASEVAAVLVGAEEAANIGGRDIIVQSLGGHIHNVPDIAGFYDPLQYPLLLPYGTYGWAPECRTSRDGKLTCCDFYSYMFQIRPNDQSVLLRAGRLLQQYAVDNFVKIETNKLRWVRSHQKEIRVDCYQGFADAVDAGERWGGNLGQRKTILLSSFVGSPRDMCQRYQDAMALVQKYGRPDLFLTMTCNPNWPEIKENLLPGQSSNDRPDLTARVFRSKFEEYKKDILSRHVLGKVIAYVYVIEFQKRGLPHAHMLIILDDKDKLSSPEDYDAVVRAEIPNISEEPLLHSAVLRHMIHGPCGKYINENASCMKGRESCKRGFPKPFSEETRLGSDSYPIYKRRARSQVHSNEDEGNIDNSWVVPYNPWLLLKYDCHINVEICCSIQSVKYLYKYVYKGPDRVSLEVHEPHSNDEVRQYVDGRWISSQEAFWRIFKFTMSRMNPCVERLQLHLPNRQSVRFYAHENLQSLLSDDFFSKTMLTEFFQLNVLDPSAINFLYREIPEHYRWLNKEKVWLPRRNNQRVIGRIYTVSPSEGERFFLRVLLNHVKGPKSFDDLLTVNGYECSTFKQAVEKHGLLESDDTIRQCLLEAVTFRMPKALRRLFVTVLVYCEPIGVRDLWNELYVFLSEDYSSSLSNNVQVLHKVLGDINRLLRQHNKSVFDYDLPELQSYAYDDSTLPQIIQDELSIPIVEDDINSIGTLNNDQRHAFVSIMEAIEHSRPAIFFVDGPGGTGKTYLYRALLAIVRGKGDIALATASSGIAATLLPGGRTSHSRFKLPLNPEPSSMCSISKQSPLAELLRRAKVIIWDEASMIHRYVFEDIMGVNLPFGGKVFVFGGDFRQTLPVIKNGTKAETIGASIVKSPLWSHVQVLRLKQNMRSLSDPGFSEFLLRIGDGSEPIIDDGLVKLPETMTIPWDNEQSIDKLIEEIYLSISSHVGDASFMLDKGLITPLNEDVNKLNERVIQKFPGREKVYYSFDRVENDPNNLYTQEFINSLSPGGMPPHVLRLKEGAPIMLLRNLDPTIGLCNGTRLICRSLKETFIDAQVLTGPFQGTRAFIPRIPLKPPESANLPFEMIRKQFPIRLSFALTINKSQGQTIPRVGIYLPDHVFTHGQLYVALSRGVSQNATKVLVRNKQDHNDEHVFTRNVVYKEVLLPNDA